MYMVPPMFFGQVPHAVILSEDCEKKYLDKVRGDIAENKCLVLVCDQNSFVQSKMVLVTYKDKAFVFSNVTSYFV